MKHELRIGNKVNIIDRSNKVNLVNPFVFEIVELKAFTVSLILSATKDYSTPQCIEVKYSDTAPIPLTEELLVKNCKFTKINERLYVKGRLLICIHEDMVTFTDDITIIRLKGLHNLQNVFYYKHDTELTIDL